MQGVEATVFGMLMSLHISSFMLGKVFGSLLTAAFGVTSGNFTNLANLVLVQSCSHHRFILQACLHVHRLQTASFVHCDLPLSNIVARLPNTPQDA